jgi:DNA repair photolyase
MAQQLELRPQQQSRRDQLVARFIQFHRDNPAVWQLFEQFTLQLIQSGRRHYSSDAVFQRIRWQIDIETRGEAVKLNDHYRAYYARMFEAKHPSHERFFRNRKLISAAKSAYAVDIAVQPILPPENEDDLMNELRRL